MKTYHYDYIRDTYLPRFSYKTHPWTVLYSHFVLLSAGIECIYLFLFITWKSTNYDFKN